jgi:hypothetical protein
MNDTTAATYQVQILHHTGIWVPSGQPVQDRNVAERRASDWRRNGKQARIVEGATK